MSIFNAVDEDINIYVYVYFLYRSHCKEHNDYAEEKTKEMTGVEKAGGDNNNNNNNNNNKGNERRAPDVEKQLKRGNTTDLNIQKQIIIINNIMFLYWNLSSFIPDEALQDPLGGNHSSSAATVPRFLWLFIIIIIIIYLFIYLFIVLVSLLGAAAAIPIIVSS
eukprot:gene9341-6564_t